MKPKNNLMILIMLIGVGISSMGMYFVTMISLFIYPWIAITSAIWGVGFLFLFLYLFDFIFKLKKGGKKK